MTTLAKPYELLEHTADIGVRAFGHDAKEVFVNAAQGMFSIIAQRKRGQKSGSGRFRIFKISLSAQNQEELLISWLSELLSLSYIHKMIFTDFQVQTLTDTTIRANAAGEKISKNNFQLMREIKAVTYHQVKIEKLPNFLRGEVFFDI